MISEMLKPKMQLSKKVSSIPEALSIYINQIVYTMKRNGMDITTLSLGEAFFDIPLFSFEKLNTEVCNHYSDSQGIPELRKRICDYYKDKYRAEVDFKKEILISAGSKPIIFIAMQAVLNSGDEVLIFEPAWLSYQEQLKLVDAIPKFIPYTSKLTEIDEYLTNKTKMVIINNPNNPAGWNYDKESLLYLYKVCREKGVYLLVDEAYSDFVVDEEYYSMVNIVPDKDGIIVVNSLSKNMGISGWRVGYVISSEEVIQNVLKLNQHLITCAPTILLYYLARYFDDIISITVPQAREVVKKRSRLNEYMKSIGLNSLGGSSTFYFFIDIENYPATSLDLCLYLLFKFGISAVPGSAYGDSTERFIRVSIGTESEERIHQALNVIKDLIDTGELDLEFVNERLFHYGIRKFGEK